MNNAPTSLATFGNEAGKGDHEPAVVRIVKGLVVTECDFSEKPTGGRVEHRSFTRFEFTHFAGTDYKKGVLRPFYSKHDDA